jgi:hypothetical protein
MRKITLKKVDLNEVIVLQQTLERFVLYPATSLMQPVELLLKMDIAKELFNKMRKSIENNNQKQSTLKFKISEAVVLFQILQLKLQKGVKLLGETEYTYFVANKYKDQLHQEIINIL